MKKNEFIEKLRAGLCGLPEEDIHRSVEFYSEIIDDKMEDGLSEEEAVAEIGDTESIVSQIVAEIPLTKLVKGKIKPKRTLKVWEIVLLVLGSPIWLSLLVAAVAVILSLYVVLWSAIISLWAIFVSIAACALGGIAAGIIFIGGGEIPQGIAVIGGAIFCAGLAIFAFFGCLAATKGLLWLTKKIALSLKKLFIKKEEA